MKRKVVAITGGIGSGKSSVAAILAKLGYQVVDCDQIARDVADDPAVLAQVSSLLGAECVTCGKLNRQAVRKRVFADQNLYRQYSNLFWEPIRRRLCAKIADAAGTVFVEIAVLDAFPMQFDEIWLVQSSTESRIARVIARDGVSEQNVREIISKQKQYAATRTLFNDGSLVDLENAVKQALQAAQIV